MSDHHIRKQKVAIKSINPFRLLTHHHRFYTISSYHPIISITLNITNCETRSQLCLCLQYNLFHLESHLTIHCFNFLLSYFLHIYIPQHSSERHIYIVKLQSLAVCTGSIKKYFSKPSYGLV